MDLKGKTVFRRRKHGNNLQVKYPKELDAVCAKITSADEFHCCCNSREPR